MRDRDRAVIRTWATVCSLTALLGTGCGFLDDPPSWPDQPSDERFRNGLSGTGGASHHASACGGIGIGHVHTARRGDRIALRPSRVRPSISVGRGRLSAEFCAGRTTSFCRRLRGASSESRRELRTETARRCRGGDPHACARLGWMFARGTGGERHVGIARSLAESACREGVRSGCTIRRTLPPASGDTAPERGDDARDS